MVVKEYTHKKRTEEENMRFLSLLAEAKRKLSAALLDITYKDFPDFNKGTIGDVQDIIETIEKIEYNISNDHTILLKPIPVKIDKNKNSSKDKVNELFDSVGVDVRFPGASRYRFANCRKEVLKIVENLEEENKKLKENEIVIRLNNDYLNFETKEQGLENLKIIMQVKDTIPKGIFWMALDKCCADIIHKLHKDMKMSLEEICEVYK